MSRSSGSGKDSSALELFETWAGRKPRWAQSLIGVILATLHGLLLTLATGNTAATPLLIFTVISIVALIFVEDYVKNNRNNRETKDRLGERERLRREQDLMRGRINRLERENDELREHIWRQSERIEYLEEIVDSDRDPDFEFET